MGRARANTVTKGFDVALGRYRGSAAAQTRRDADESMARTPALEEYAQNILNSSQIMGSAQSSVRFLINSYLFGAHVEGAPGHSTLMNQLDVSTHVETSSHVRDLANMIGRGDPIYCEGLTAPAIEALGRYFTGKTSKQLEGNKRIEAVMVMNICFTAPVECGKVKPRSHYRRLQPLCQGLGALIARQGDLAGLQVRTRAWQILLSAPPATLTGPLHSWMQAFAAHAEADNISVAQRQTLQEALTARADEPGFIAAFSEIVENLQALESSG